MFRRVFAGMLAAVVVCAVPAGAMAAGGWEWPVSGGSALRYGEAYTGPDGGSRTHGGLDVSAGAGSSVEACTAGEVVFAGLIPAGEGARSWAVTVLTGDGLRVTYLPLASADVRKGQDVTTGGRLGELAASGDASSDAPHLHLGVKRGSAPLDPLGFLGPRGTAAPVHPQAAPSGRANAPRPSVRGPSPGAVRLPAGSAVPAGAAAWTGAGSAAAALNGALRTLAQAPPLARMERISAPTSVDLAHVQSDMDAARGSVLTFAVRAGLLLLAIGCAWPVMRSARAAGLSAAPVPVRRSRV
jgi:hypothetical protein